MTNAQIMMNLHEQLGIPELVPMLTYGEWQKAGYQVKKGEHGIKVRLWKHVDGARARQEDAEDGQEQMDGFIMKVCHLFLPNQVEAVKA